MHTYPYVLKRVFFFGVLVFRAQNDHQNATSWKTLSRVEDRFPLLVWNGMKKENFRKRDATVSDLARNKHVSLPLALS